MREKYFPSATFPRYLSSVPVKMFGMSTLASIYGLDVYFRKLTHEKVRNHRNYVKARSYRGSKNVLCDKLCFFYHDYRNIRFARNVFRNDVSRFAFPLTDDTFAKYRGYKIRNPGAFRTQMCSGIRRGESRNTTHKSLHKGGGETLALSRKYREAIKTFRVLSRNLFRL